VQLSVTHTRPDAIVRLRGTRSTSVSSAIESSAKFRVIGLSRVEIVEFSKSRAGLSQNTNSRLVVAVGSSRINGRIPNRVC